MNGTVDFGLEPAAKLFPVLSTASELVWRALQHLLVEPPSHTLRREEAVQGGLSVHAELHLEGNQADSTTNFRRERITCKMPVYIKKAKGS